MYKHTLLVVWAGLLVSSLAIAQAGPRITGVEPATISAGGTLTVKGEKLRDRSLEEIALFKDGTSHALQIMDKQDAMVTARVPRVSPAKYSLALKIQGVTYTEPVEVTVE